MQSNLGSAVQTSIVLTLCKIINWEHIQSQDIFQINIQSAKTESIILSKSIKANFCQNEAIFNYSLRVNYPSDQNQIRVKLSHKTKLMNTMNVITQFTLNLDNLRTSKMQFFPFGKNDKIIKIILGEPQKIQISPKPSFKQQDQYFIRQKEEFLKNIMKKTANTKHDNSLPKKSFSQKALNLLSQIQSIRPSKNTRRNQLQSQYGYYNQDEKESIYLRINLPQTKKFNKSHSERAFLNPKTHRRGFITNRPQQEYQKRSNKTQKHKLAIKSLEMLACQNEYYQESDYTSTNGQSTMRPENRGAPSKRLIKSKLY